MFPAVTPVRRNTVFDAFRAFCCHDEPAIPAPSDEIPAAIPPRISLRDEEIGGKAQLDYRMGRYVLILELIGGFSLLNFGRIPAVSSILLIYKTVFAARTYLFASMPRIPRDCVINFSILHSCASSKRNDVRF